MACVLDCCRGLAASFWLCLTHDSSLIVKADFSRKSHRDFSRKSQELIEYVFKGSGDREESCKCWHLRANFRQLKRQKTPQNTLEILLVDSDGRRESWS